MSFFSNFFKKTEYVDLSPPIIPHSPYSSSLLLEAIEEAKKVRATTLAAGRSVFEGAFNSNSHTTKSIDAVEDDVTDAIEDVKPQIGYPGFVKPTKAPKDPETKLEDINPFTPYYYKKSNAIQDVYDSMKIGMPSVVNQNQRYYKPTSASDAISERFKKLAGISGAIQPRLNPNNITNRPYVYQCAIGNPYNSHIRINSIQNSRQKTINFKDNREVIEKGINLFNRLIRLRGVNNLETKPILVGHSLNSAEIKLTFHQLSFTGEEIQVEFSKYNLQRNGGIGDNYDTWICSTCYFFLEGEIMLDEDEVEITELNITALSYMNIGRMTAREQLFVV